MNFNTFKKVFKYCRDNPISTLEEATDVFYPERSKYEKYIYVYLKHRYIDDDSVGWEVQYLIEKEDWKILEDQSQFQIEIDDKQVWLTWYDLETDYYDNPEDVVNQVNSNPKSEDDWKESELYDLVYKIRSNKESYYTQEYMKTLLAKVYPFEGEKPNTTLIESIKGGNGEFVDKQFQKIIDKQCQLMSINNYYNQYGWQKKFIELIDEMWGGTSGILKVPREKWYEAYYEEI